MVGTGYIFIHDTAKKLDIFANLQYSYIGHMFFSSLFAMSHEAPSINFQEISVFYILAFVGVVGVGFVAQYLIYTSNSLKQPSKVMPFAYAGIITGFLADLYLFHTSFTLLAVLGILLTGSGLLGNLIM